MESAALWQTRLLCPVGEVVSKPANGLAVGRDHVCEVPFRLRVTSRLKFRRQWNVHIGATVSALDTDSAYVLRS
jgi:hypothetical protein